MSRMPETYITDRLESFNSRIRVVTAIRGLLLNLTVFSFLSSFLLYLDALLKPRSTFVMGFIVFFLIVQCWGIYRWLVNPLRRPLGSHGLARLLDRAIPPFHGRLVAAVEARGDVSYRKWGYSDSLRRKAFGSAAAILERLRHPAVVRRLGFPERPGSPVLYGGLVVCWLATGSGLFFGKPVSLVSSVDRVLHPLMLYRAERTWDLKIRPGDIRLRKGETLLVEVVSPEKAKPLEPVLHIAPGRMPPVHHAMVGDGDGRFRFELGTVEEDLSYYVTEGMRTSPRYRVDVVEPPGITDLTFRIIPPSYAGLPLVEVGRETDRLSALPGSRVEVMGRSDKGLRRAYLDFFVREDVELGLIDRRDFIGGFPIVPEDSFRVVLIDTSGIRFEGKAPFSVKVRGDGDPEVRIVVPGADTEIDRDLEEILRFRVIDDYGIRELGLYYVLEARSGEEKSRREIVVARFDGTPKDTVVDFSWDLRGLNLFPGDRVKYRGWVKDNDDVSGPKSGWSRSYLFTLPTVTEIFSRRNEEIGETAEGVRDLIDETTRLREAIESLERELTAAGEVDWEGRREVSEVMRKQEALSRDLKRLGEDFRRRAGEMDRRHRISPEIMERVEEVATLFQEVATPEMIAAMEELRKALQEVDPKMLEQALQKMKFSEEEFRKGLERTYQALKKLKMEQRLEALIEEASDILERQGEVNDELDPRNTASDGGKWKRDEELIARDTDRLLGEMRSATEELRGGGETGAAGELESLSRELEDSGLRSQMEKMMVAIQGGAIERAKGMGEGIQGELVRLRDNLDEIRENLRKKWREGTEVAINRAIQDLLSLSHSEERLAETMPRGDFTPQSLDALIAEQSALTGGLERVAEYLFRTTEETYFIGRDVGKKIGAARNQMHRVSRSLESQGKASPSTRKELENIMASLNGAIFHLMRDKESMMESSSGTGFEEALKRMMELAGAQAALNEQSGGFLPIPMPGGSALDPSLREEFLRMAAEQRRIQEELRALEDALSGGEGLMGNLDRVADEMERVAEDLSRGELREETIERQKKILSRLLDAEKSLKKQDSSKKREAERPDPYEPVQPPPLALELLTDEERADDSIIPLGEGAYPKGYRDVIQIYFDKLLEETEREGGK